MLGKLNQGIVKLSSRGNMFSRKFSVAADVFEPTDTFTRRHIGTEGSERQKMLEVVGFKSLEDLIDSTVPKSIRLEQNLRLDKPLSESEALNSLKKIMSKNKVLKSFIGVGYYETLTPSVILRNVS
jgi:glycine dehydrogenase